MNNHRSGPPTIFAYHLSTYADSRGRLRTEWLPLCGDLGEETVSCEAGCEESDAAMRVPHGLAVHEAFEYLKLGWGFHFRYIDEDRGGWEGKW
jgi:hypothetical protein